MDADGRVRPVRRHRLQPADRHAVRRGDHDLALHARQHATARQRRRPGDGGPGGHPQAAPGLAELPAEGGPDDGPARPPAARLRDVRPAGEHLDHRRLPDLQHPGHAEPGAGRADRIGGGRSSRHSRPDQRQEAVRAGHPRAAQRGPVHPRREAARPPGISDPRAGRGLPQPPQLTMARREGASMQR